MIEGFRLEHRSGYKFRFNAFLKSATNVGTDDNGKLLALKQWQVFGLRYSPGSEPKDDLPIEEKKRLIQQALFAYGSIFNCPSGPVSVEYLD